MYASNPHITFKVFQITTNLKRKHVFSAELTCEQLKNNFFCVTHFNSFRIVHFLMHYC